MKTAGFTDSLIIGGQVETSDVLKAVGSIPTDLESSVVWGTVGWLAAV